MFDRRDPNRIINFRPLLFAAVGLVLGIAAFIGYGTLRLKGGPLSLVLLIFFSVAAAALCCFAVIRRKSALFILLFAFLIGFARMLIIPTDSFENGEYTVIGTVVSDNDGKEGRLILSNVTVDGVKLHHRMRMNLKNASVPEVGDVIETRCSVRNPSMRFGSYDERTRLMASGISSVASCSEYKVIRKGAVPLTKALNDVRRYLGARIEYLFDDNADIVCGFLLGDRSGVEEEDYEDFVSTGTSHLLSLSGFHVGILASVLFFLLPKCFPWLRFTIVGLFLLFYCALTAFSPSLVRASIMCGCLMLADVTEERRDALSSLSLAALIILIVQPYKIFSVGFRLSFAATLGILFLTSSGIPAFKSRIVSKVVSAALITIGATAATALISAQYFNTFQTYGIIANVIAVPVFSLAVTLSFAVLLIGLIIPPAAHLLAFVPDKLITGGMIMLRAISSLPGAQISVFSPSTLSGVLMLVVMFCISQYVLRPLNKRIRLTMLAFLLFTASVIADIIRA
ncbi:MAG: competence protein ComEC family protein [Clostridiales bacterium]|nr:competence protein ComEC family protein [Clostridiales bacterium]